MTSGQQAARIRATATILLTALVIFVLDHVVKWIIATTIPLGTQVPASGPVTLHDIHNTGAAFGLFPQLQWVFLLVAVVVCGYIIFAGHSIGGDRITTLIMLGFVLGGAAANAVDRFVQGYVVDFIDFHVWPVFNIADSAIVIGIFCLIVQSWRRPPERHDDK